MVNLDTNEEEVLSERKYKRCRFKEWFRYKNYEIQLRWDFKHIANDEPMLKADIKDKTTGKLLEKGKRIWHHTEMKYDTQPKRKIYTFDFESLRLRLYIIRTMGKVISVDAILRRESEV